jgi:rhodanese-related sulfurtransferase
MAEHDEEFLRKAAEARARITEIHPGEVDTATANGAVIVDVRASSEYEAGHADGAINVNMSTLAHDIRKMAPDQAQPIICYCSSGNRGALAADALQKLDYINVTSICGGLKAYSPSKQEG